MIRYTILYLFSEDEFQLIEHIRTKSHGFGEPSSVLSVLENNALEMVACVYQFSLHQDQDGGAGNTIQLRMFSHPSSSY